MDLLNMETFGRIVAHGEPEAVAVMRGSDVAPRISGTVRFYRAGKGTQVVAEIFHLPRRISLDGKMQDSGPFYGFHIHEGTACGSGAGNDPFKESKAHFNPTHSPHPLHAGDLPTILSDSGYGYISVYTSRFTPSDVIGRTVIIHQNADDYHTQPSGNPGIKIACGKIEVVRR